MELDKIIEGLETCSRVASCYGCPYRGENDCGTMMKKDASAAIKELREKVALHTVGDPLKGVVDEATMGAITEMRSEIEAQAQVIETLRDINSRLEGKVEAYEHALRLAIE